jgi:hypothetical protein
MDRYVEVVLDDKKERYFRESGTLLTSLELLNKMINSMAME